MAGSDGAFLFSMAKREIIERFVKLILYHDLFALQLYRAAGEAGVCGTVNEGWQHDKVDTVQQRISSIVIMAAEAGLDGGRREKKF